MILRSLCQPVSPDSLSEEPGLTEEIKVLKSEADRFTQGWAPANYGWERYGLLFHLGIIKGLTLEHPKEGFEIWMPEMEEKQE